MCSQRARPPPEASPPPAARAPHRAATAAPTAAGAARGRRARRRDDRPTTETPTAPRARARAVEVRRRGRFPTAYDACGAIALDRPPATSRFLRLVTNEARSGCWCGLLPPE